MLNNQKELILLKDLGRLYPNENSKQKERYGLYECSFCKNKFKTQIRSVKLGKTKSCGCIGKNKTHGFKNHRLYDTWNSMLKRCNNINSQSYKNYGARGITVCDRWLNVANFIEDMYPTFQEGLSIDRIDNNGNYEPNNCRWANRNIQNCNTRLLRVDNTSGFRGVSWSKEKSKWAASISVENKIKYLGSFVNKIEAAEAYDNYVIANNLEHTKNFS